MAKPVPYTAKRKKHNPERSEWRGRSYKKGGERITSLRQMSGAEAADATSISDMVKAAKAGRFDVREHDRKTLRDMVAMTGQSVGSLRRPELEAIIMGWSKQSGGKPTARVGTRTFSLDETTGLAFLTKGPALPSESSAAGKKALATIRRSLPERGAPNTIERRQGWRLGDETWVKGGREPGPRPPQRCIADVKNEMVFTMGLPGAGKSYMLKRLSIPETHVIIDPDEVKKTLPGYDPKNPGLVHDESTAIAEAQFQKALKSGKGRYAVDGTGTNAEKMVRRIREAQRRGFYTRVVYVRVSMPTAIKRNAARERSVPEAIIREKAADIETAADIVMREVQCFQQFDND